VKKFIALFILCFLNTSFADVKICKVYWDGWVFKTGKKSPPEYKTLIIERYGVENLNIALPKPMYTELECDDIPRNSNPFEGSNSCSVFLKKYWSDGTIPYLCK
jgi:hypothetical protein